MKRSSLLFKPVVFLLPVTRRPGSPTDRDCLLTVLWPAGHQNHALGRACRGLPMPPPLTSTNDKTQASSPGALGRESYKNNSL